MERKARREQKAERDRQRLEWEEYRRKKLEKLEEAEIRYQIRTGQRAVGSDKTILRWV